MPKIGSITTSLNTTAEEDTKEFIYHHVSQFESCINDLTSVEGECSGVYSDIDGNVALSDHAFVVEGRGYLYEEKLELLERFNNLFGSGYNILNDAITALNNLVPEHNGNEWSKYFELIDKERNTLIEELDGYKDAANAARSYTVTTRSDDDEGTKTETKESPEVTYDQNGTPPALVSADANNPNSAYSSNIESLNAKLPDLGKWNQKIIDAQEYQATAAGKVAGFNCPWTSYGDASKAGADNILNEREFAEKQAQGDYSEYDSYQDYLNDMYTKYGPGGTEKIKEEYGDPQAASSETTGDQGEASGDQTEASAKSENAGQTAKADFSNISDDSWSRQVSYTNPGNVVVYEEAHDADGNLVSRASSPNGNVLYYSVNKDGQSKWYDANGNEITTGTALAMQSVANFGKVDSEQWQRETVITNVGDTAQYYSLNSNYKDMKIDLTTNSAGEPLYFSTTNENGEKVYYDWNYNQISREEAEGIRKQYNNN